MELTHEFRVGVPPEQAWAVLTDVERIAPCLPGAELREVEGDEYRGVVKVKVGPITAQYKGKAHFVEQDQAAGRVVLRAEGRDTRGQGNANATITATLTPDGDGTRVSVVTDLAISGRVAQFGRGMLADVSAKLLGQFVDCVHEDLLSASGIGAGGAGHVVSGADVAGAAPIGEATPATTAAPTSTVTAAPSTTAVAVDATLGPNGAAAPSPPGAGIRRIEGPSAKPVDLIDTAGGSVAKRAVPALAIVLLLLLGLRRRRRRAARR
jgi:carbon monoxide dehydrogenase subunit G